MADEEERMEQRIRQTTLESKYYVSAITTTSYLLFRQFYMHPVHDVRTSTYRDLVMFQPQILPNQSFEMGIIYISNPMFLQESKRGGPAETAKEASHLNPSHLRLCVGFGLHLPQGLLMLVRQLASPHCHIHHTLPRLPLILFFLPPMPRLMPLAHHMFSRLLLLHGAGFRSRVLLKRRAPLRQHGILLNRVQCVAASGLMGVVD